MHIYVHIYEMPETWYNIILLQQNVFFLILQPISPYNYPYSIQKHGATDIH